MRRLRQSLVRVPMVNARYGHAGDSLCDIHDLGEWIQQEE